MALMRVADLHMHIDDMGAPDASPQMVRWSCAPAGDATITLRPTGRARRRRSPKMRCLRISVHAVPDGCS
jgi:hypothetical protein